jgi:hypothetical protein
MLTPLQHSALQKLEVNGANLASVSEDQMLTPLQHNALQSAESAQNKHGQLCQRIRNADSSATQCTERCAARTNNWHLCQRIRMLTDSLQHRHCKRSAATAQNNMAAVSEDQEC